ANVRVRSLCKIGLDFFEFLKETNRTSITDKDQLKYIYNTEFRKNKDPSFGSVLYSLKVTNKITRRHNTIRFNATGFHCKSKHGYSSLQFSKLHNVIIPCYCLFTHSRHPSLLPVLFLHAAKRRMYLKLSSYLMQATLLPMNHNLCSFCTHRAQFIADKHGISISCDQPFENGKLRLPFYSFQQCVIKLKVENTGTEPVYFTYYTPLHWLKYFTLMDEHKVTKLKPLLLKPGDSYEIQVLFNCSLVGLYPATLAFEFKPDLQVSTAFYIVRFIEAHCITSLGLELAPEAPYKPRSLPAWKADFPCEIVDGQPPEGYHPFLSMLLIQTVVLKKYQIPAYMNQLIQSLKRPASFPDKRALLESPLSWENYTEKFQLLLYLEELQMEVDIKRYNIPNDEKDYAVMYKDPHNKKLLVLEVPGVSENRPSVLRGDQLLVCPVGETKVKYRGYVHSVQLDQVKLGFSSELLDRFIEGMQFSVEFTINRLTVRLQHRAAELAATYRLGQVLFPAAPPFASQQTKLPGLKLFDWKLERNPEQYQAVQHIVAGSSKPAPYLVFGPPGTGKTVTMVEAIKQIEKTEQSCHILACAPSNSAADLLCRKILEHVDEHKVYRMYATSRDPKMVPEELKACSNLVGDSYIYPAKEELMKYRIMVTTLLTAGRLVTGGIPSGHFTHMFVDEAGHAVETECVIPLAGLLNAESGQVVLAGDPKQLGPILRSPFALKFDMGMSLLERLMTNFPVYCKEDGVFNNCFVTKLLCNYRSHPAILKVPNELFYDGELQVCADEILRNSYCGWEYLPKMVMMLLLVETNMAATQDFCFIFNEKVNTLYTFNVAVTRAKALLIVVGNPVVLNTDPTWGHFIKYCQDEGGYTGFTHVEEDEDVVARLAALSIEIEVETAESAMQQHVDPEWRQ
uniref:RNA helicase n=1 Tax=Acanthochromis polyacanthus TaxID=80966 RepID=A0A3Q1FUN6_9TELE